ncbi:GAF and ANTAR domain-containing protein [Mycolicibacterium flavescens]|uniref:Histidine kinase n=1 Tax=Mycolicibacterium flavescens TaxID=1776 RepID=A0A1E3RLV5_MYCFV|nr:GAF and ANTAR domain-containing protein [Mycolicibacterium flavescens]MCV7281758.1 GAF and ANTAR domain-containing protein [Mycolicibacterium flavescens]ODQ90851.1 histidine kinase [Mycolicibacterium flavescens]
MADYDAQTGRESVPDTDLSSAQRDADEADLHAGLAGVAGLVAGARPVVDLLGDVAGFAARAIPDVDGAGVALASLDGRGNLETRAATADFVWEIDGVQYDELNEGPCLTAMQTARPTVSGSLGSDQRWPHFGGRVARMDVHSALSLPLVVDDRVIGVINAYARQRDAFGEHAVQLGTQFAGPAAVSVYHGQLLAHARERTAQLQRALASRAVIDQAIGIIRSRSGVTAEEAFDRLTRLSQAENIKLYVVAERLVDEAVRRARARQQP